MFELTVHIAAIIISAGLAYQGLFTGSLRLSRNSALTGTVARRLGGICLFVSVLLTAALLPGLLSLGLFR